jgi:DNA polymerase-1
MKRLYLVDVSSMFFRAFYAIRQLSNPQGMPTNAVYGFLSMTVKLLREIKPDYMAFCWDRSEDTFRKELDPRYKAHRSEMPADLVPQIPYIRKISDALGIPCFSVAGFEADDLIGTLTKIGRQHNLEVVIVSGDKDFGQLVAPHVSMYDTMKEMRYDEAGVLEKWGIEPYKVIDYLALVGDASDNIPGVKGIGPKGAQTLLNQFNSLEDLYANLDKVANPNLKAKLEVGKDEAFLSKKLVTIVTDMNLNCTIDDLKLKPIDRVGLEALLIELDFKSMAKTLLGATFESQGSLAAKDKPAPRPASVADGSEELAHQPSSESAASPSPSIEVGQSSRSFQESQKDLAGLQTWLRPKSEVWGLQTERGLFIAQDDEVAQLVGYDEADPRELGQILEKKDLRWKGYDLKSFAKDSGLLRFAVDWDQMLAAYVIRAGTIENVATLFQLYNGYNPPELAGPGDLLNAHLHLEQALRKKATNLGQDKVLSELEFPLISILTRMEAAGVRIDTAVLSEQAQSLNFDLQKLEEAIHAEAGEKFNIGSPKQLALILFEKLKMPAGRKTKTGYSTDNKVLEVLADDYPLARQIVQYRELAKLKSTYVDALPALIHPKTGRIHTTFNQAATTTGRLSSTHPNLQNIPIRTERGNLIRRAFVADDQMDFVSADYSQIELRILAHITDDPGLLRAFAMGVDIHSATAAEVFDVALEDVTPEMRRKAKAVNFGLAYGQGAFGLAEVLRISRKEATEIIQRYFTRFSRVQNFMTDIVETAKKQGYVETLLGRRRYIDELFSGSAMVRKFGERAAVNAPIQGTASDLVKKAMIAVDGNVPAKMILQVHDELIFETDETQVESACVSIKNAMESINILKVPLNVNVGAGKNWDEAHA